MTDTKVKKRLHKIDKLNALHHEKLEGGFLQFLLPALAPLAVDMFKNLISGKNVITGQGMHRKGRGKSGGAESGGSEIRPLTERNQMIIGMGKGRKKRASPTKESKWIKHVKAYAKEHGIKYPEALKKAKDTYKK